MKNLFILFISFLLLIACDTSSKELDKKQATIDSLKKILTAAQADSLAKKRQESIAKTNELAKIKADSLLNAKQDSVVVPKQKEKKSAINANNTNNINSNNNIYGSFIDSRDGHKYKTIKIGTQVWMAENLAYKTSDGSRSYKDNSSYDSEYGRLYTRTTASSACPSGWHVSSLDEWTVLCKYLGCTIQYNIWNEPMGYSGGIGDKLKETGTKHWNSPNSTSNNSSGFTALPCGMYNGDFGWDPMGNMSNFWTSTIVKANSGEYGNKCIYIEGGDYGNDVGINFLSRCYLNVRCIKD